MSYVPVVIQKGSLNLQHGTVAGISTHGTYDQRQCRTAGISILGRNWNRQSLYQSHGTTDSARGRRGAPICVMGLFIAYLFMNRSEKVFLYQRFWPIIAERLGLSGIVAEGRDRSEPSLCDNQVAPRRAGLTACGERCRFARRCVRNRQIPYRCAYCERHRPGRVGRDCGRSEARPCSARDGKQAGGPLLAPEGIRHAMSCWEKEVKCSGVTALTQWRTFDRFQHDGLWQSLQFVHSLAGPAGAIHSEELPIK